MIRFLGFWCLHFSKKIGQIKSATYFQVLTVMNSSCPKTLTWLAQTWDSHLLPAVPSRSHILWKRSRRYLPSRISFRMWYRASSCDTSSNGPSFSKKNLLKEAPEWKHPLIYSQSLASATCNEWTSEKASCELLGKKYKKKNDFFVLEIQVELDIPMASAPTCQGTLTLETWNHPNLYIKCHDL